MRDSQNSNPTDRIAHEAARLYHLGRVDTIGDAVRIAKKAQRENVGVMFNLCHFLKQKDEADLKRVIAESAPHLMLVSINGADAGQTRAMGWDWTILALVVPAPERHVYFHAYGDWLR